MFLHMKFFLICKSNTIKIQLADRTPETTKRLRWMIQKENKNTMIYSAANEKTALQLFTAKNPVRGLVEYELLRKRKV
jgi:hypothetical protein